MGEMGSGIVRRLSHDSHGFLIPTSFTAGDYDVYSEPRQTSLELEITLPTKPYSLASVALIQ
jgi:hypothetical protein